MTEETKDTEKDIDRKEFQEDCKEFQEFAKKMASDNEFRSDALLATVALIIRNITVIEKRLDFLEKALGSIVGLGMANDCKAEGEEEDKEPENDA